MNTVDAIFWAIGVITVVGLSIFGLGTLLLEALS